MLLLFFKMLSKRVYLYDVVAGVSAIDQDNSETMFAFIERAYELSIGKSVSKDNFLENCFTKRHRSLFERNRAAEYSDYAGEISVYDVKAGAFLDFNIPELRELFSHGCLSFDGEVHSDRSCYIVSDREYQHTPDDLKANRVFEIVEGSTSLTLNRFELFALRSRPGTIDSKSEHTVFVVYDRVKNDGYIAVVSHTHKFIMGEHKIESFSIVRFKCLVEIGTPNFTVHLVSSSSLVSKSSTCYGSEAVLCHGETSSLTFLPQSFSGSSPLTGLVEQLV